MPLKCGLHSETPELILLICGSGELTTADVTQFSKFFDSYLNSSQAFKLFIDLRKVESAPINALTAMASYMANNDELAKKRVIASSVLVGNTHIENLLNLLFRMKEPSTPTKVTMVTNDACNFLDKY
jgi:hypothetical protein